MTTQELDDKKYYNRYLAYGVLLRTPQGKLFIKVHEKTMVPIPGTENRYGVIVMSHPGCGDALFFDPEMCEFMYVHEAYNNRQKKLVELREPEDFIKSLTKDMELNGRRLGRYCDWV